jgi:hypothetical protein
MAHGQFPYDVVLFAPLQAEPGTQAGPGIPGRVAGTDEPEPKPFPRRRPHIALQAGITHPVRAEAGAGVQPQPQPCRAPYDTHPAQQDETVGGGRHRQGVAALDHGVGAHPPVHPDEGALLLGPAPHVPAVRGLHREVPGATDQRGEDRVAVPARRAQPDDPALRIHQCSALAVGEDGVLPQHPRRAGGVGC